VIAFPEYPPRVRVEWLLAGARVVLAGGLLLATAFGPLDAHDSWLVPYILAGYLVYSLAILAVVWAPVRFERGWDVAVHVCDIIVLSILAGTGHRVVYVTFLLLSATVRWQVPGTLWTAAATLVVYAAATVYSTAVLQQPFAFDAFVMATIYLVVITGLLGYLGAHQHRFEQEVGRIASWPRTISGDTTEVVSEILAQSGELLDAPRVLLVWEEPGADWVNLAWRANGTLGTAREPEGAFGSLVLPELERHCFLAPNVEGSGRVVALETGVFRRRDCVPVDDRLRARFDMRAVQSFPVSSELVSGRLFCLDKTRMRLDDLVVGQLVARLVVSRLETVYLLARLRSMAALEERVRLARDLHDGILQSQAGTALQLLAARRLLDRDPHVARTRLEQIQQQLEQNELEMRSFIRDLRPSRRDAAGPAPVSLGERLEDLKRRIEHRWAVTVDLRIDTAVERLPEVFLNQVYRLAQEAVVNAARHADATRIQLLLSVSDERLSLEIADDGHGFPFRGSYELADLRRMSQGPLTLQERVTQLSGDLTLTSASTGSELSITLPVGSP
jgi:signal transduction histidine kinase